MPLSGVPTVPTVSPTVVTKEERQLIIQEATKQLLENGKVVRLQIKKALGWNSDKYKKIMAVCDELGWHKNMQPRKLSTEQKQTMREQAVCTECGSTDNLEIDHIFPRSLGGPSTPDNLQVLCGTCNRQKGVKHEQQH
jgi:HNH endonuclease